MAAGKTHVQATRPVRTLRRKPSIPVRIARSHQRQTPAISTALILQPALKVGAANDPLEREAETMAERVVSMPSPGLAVPDGTASNGPPADARRASIDDQPNTDELETVPPVPEDHQDPDVPPQEDVAAEDLTGNDMEELESGQPEDTAGEPPANEAPALPADEDAALASRDGDSAAVG